MSFTKDAKVTVHPLTPDRRNDFYRLHSAANGCGWCCCVAWWVETWDGWGDRTAEQNRKLRDELFDRGEYDGFLAYNGDIPVGWCQVGPRDRLVKLTRQFSLSPDPDTWAVTCFVVAPAYRRHGVARLLLYHVIDVLRNMGMARLEAFPRRTAEDEGELWTGPERVFIDAGFVMVRDDSVRPVYRLELNPDSGRISR